MILQENHPPNKERERNKEIKRIGNLLSICITNTVLCNVHEIYTIRYSHIYIFNLIFMLICDDYNLYLFYRL